VLKIHEILYSNEATRVSGPNRIKGDLPLRAFAVAALLLGLSPAANAVLGEARLQSGLGQPLRAFVPTTGVTAEDLEARCFRVFRPAASEGIPFPNDIRLDIEEISGAKRLFVRTRGAVQEPVVRFGVEWTCGASVKREYTLLIDPLPVAEASAAPALPPIVSAPLSSGSTSGTGRVGGENVTVYRDPVPPRAPQPVTPRAPRMAEGTAAATPRVRAAAQARLAIRGGVEGLSRDLDLAVLTSPTLKMSTLLTLGGVGAAPLSEVDRAVMASRRERLLRTPIESDLRPQLEVDLMIAQKRIAELQARINAADPKGLTLPSTGTLSAPTAVAGASATDQQKPQAVQLPVAIAQPQAPAAPTATTEPVKAPVASAAVKSPSREQSPEGGSVISRLMQWLWIPALAAVAAGVWSLLWLKRKRAQESQERAYAAAAAAVGLSPSLDAGQERGDEVNTRTRALDSLLNPTSRTNPDSVRTVKPVRAEAGGSAAPRRVETPIGMTTIKGASSLGPMDLSAELFQPNFDTAELGVSMVSAVTEEASVYVELGRVEEAIAVLKDHIELERAYARATPAPWLMLLDLYHRADNRPDFEALRSDFMKNFNGRVPEWGAFQDLNSEKSLIEHDHIVERLIKYWSTPKCHQYIQKLLYDHRDNSRIGFSLTAYRELVMLDSIHNSAFPPIEQVAMEMPKDED
jgi:hypothetical protein